MNTRKVALAIALAALASACSSGGGAGGGEQHSDAAINSYVASLVYDPATILSVQNIPGGASMARTAQGAPTETNTPNGNDLIECTTVQYNLQENADQVAILRPTNGIVWPGALVKGNAALVDGTPEPITLAPGPITLRIDLPGMGDQGTMTIAQPSNSSVQTAINGALAWWNDNAYQQGYVNPANSSYNVTKSSSSEQLAMDVGLNVKWASGDASAQFSYTSSTTSTVAMMVFKQVFYTVTMDTPSSPAAMFGSSVLASQLSSQMSADSPPAYVHSVAYGRIIMFRMETSDAYTSTDVEGAMKYSAGFTVDATLKTKYDTILSKSTMTAITIGGNAAVASQSVTAKTAGDLDPIITGANAVYSKDNPGVPIAYTVRFLKDNTIATMGYTTNYSSEECTRSVPVVITVRNSSGLYTARASASYFDHVSQTTVSLGEHDNITIGTNADFNVPAGADSVTCGAQEWWGFGWTNVFNLTWTPPANHKLCLHGTTLSPSYSTDDC